MSKRFHSTEVWGEDWFISLSSEEKFLWFFILDDCDHAGIWKPNKFVFEATIRGQVDLKKALQKFNSDKPRIEVLDNGRWYVIDFIQFQYGEHLNPKNRVHFSIIQILKLNGVNLTSIRVLQEDNDTLKDKDKDKDKDKEKDILDSKEGIQKEYSIPFEAIISDLNTKAGTSYKHTTRKTQDFIRARWNEGFRESDFFKVHDHQCAKWLTDHKMKEYIRPETLYGTKFEGYLNNPPTNGGDNGPKKFIIRGTRRESFAEQRDRERRERHEKVKRGEL